MARVVFFCNLINFPPKNAVKSSWKTDLSEKKLSKFTHFDSHDTSSSHTAIKYYPDNSYKRIFVKSTLRLEYERTNLRINNDRVIHFIIIAQLGQYARECIQAEEESLIKSTVCSDFIHSYARIKRQS